MSEASTSLADERQRVVQRLKARAARSRGLGDTIAKVTNALGIPSCPGCKKRQDWANKLLPYNE